MNSDHVTRSPLSWPAGWTRTPGHQRRRAQFSTRRTAPPGGYGLKQQLSVAQATARLDGELSRLGARDEILSTNLRLRLDGFPRSDQGEPPDPGVAVYFTLKKKDRCLACDRWTRVADNIAAIAAHIEALRAIERYGVGTLDQAFTGYTAIAPSAAHDWALVLGVPAHATLDQVDAGFREKARTAHPDVAGGSHDAMARLVTARNAAREALKVAS